jgi:hypothetical protein
MRASVRSNVHATLNKAITISEYPRPLGGVVVIPISFSYISARHPELSEAEGCSA